MTIRSYRAYTPGTRNRSISDFFELDSQTGKTKPEKKLTRFSHRATGRNNRGIITSRHRGGGHKRKYRQIDFRRNKYDCIGSIQSVEYDPNRNSHIALVAYEDGEKTLYSSLCGFNCGDKNCFKSRSSKHHWKCAAFSQHAFRSGNP